MVNQKLSIISILKKTYSETTIALKKDHRIYLPFLIFALVEGLSLVLLYLAPREPFRAAMGPIIRTVWGEQFLHYPQNFLLLPKLAGFARMGLSVVLGSLLSGMAVAYLYKKPLATAFNKYANIMVVIFLLTLLYYLANRGVHLFLIKYFTVGHPKFLFIGPKWWLGSFSVVISQTLALILQAVFAYAVPIIVATDKKFFSAIIGSFMLCIRNLRVTFFLIVIPLLISVPLILLNYNGAFLMLQFSPEAILWVGLLGVVLNSLLLDPMITLTTATFYKESAGK